MQEDIIVEEKFITEHLKDYQAIGGDKIVYLWIYTECCST